MTKPLPARLRVALAAVLVSLFAAGAASAQREAETSSVQLMDSYVARLSAQDHVNSRGQRLDSVAMILRQDRANVHRFGRLDPEDEIDTVFVDAGSREQMELFLASGGDELSPADERAILDGTPLVRVEVYESYIVVTLLEE